MPRLPPVIFKQFFYGSVPRGAIPQEIINAAYANDPTLKRYQQSVKNCKTHAEELIKFHLKRIESIRKKIKHLRKHPPGKARTMTAMGRRKLFVRQRTQQIWLRDKLLAMRHQRQNFRPQPNASPQTVTEYETGKDREDVSRQVQDPPRDQVHHDQSH